MMSPLKHLLAFVVVCSVEFAVVDGQNTTLAVDNSTLAITTDADNSTDIYTTDITVIGNSTTVVGTTLADDNSTVVTTDASLTTVDSSIICYVCDESNDQDCGTDLSSTGDYNETCQYNCWTILDSNGNTSRICNDTYESGSTSLSCDAASSQVCIDASGVTECFYCCSSDYCNSETLSGSSRLPVASFITLLVAIVVSATNRNCTDSELSSTKRAMTREMRRQPVHGKLTNHGRGTMTITRRCHGNGETLTLMTVAEVTKQTNKQKISGSENSFLKTSQPLFRIVEEESTQDCTLVEQSDEGDNIAEFKIVNNFGFSSIL